MIKTWSLSMSILSGLKLLFLCLFRRVLSAFSSLENLTMIFCSQSSSWHNYKQSCFLMKKVTRSLTIYFRDGINNHSWILKVIESDIFIKKFQWPSSEINLFPISLKSKKLIKSCLLTCNYGHAKKFKIADKNLLEK